jgi:Flp pilus assembly protein protease CpaA
VSLKPFFPNLAYAWTFYAILIGLLVLAAFVDLRHRVVPKWLSLTTLALGVACNVARGAWMGGLDSADWGLGPQWSWAPHGAWLGAADGLLFTLAGFSTGFGIFFVMWLVGACAGGDVKLFAAVSAWVGPYISLWILALSTIILVILLVLKLGVLFLIQSPKASQPSAADNKGKATVPNHRPLARDPRMGRDPRVRGLTYSLPLALATALALLWFFRCDLKLAQPRPQLAEGPPVNSAGMQPLASPR